MEPSNAVHTRRLLTALLIVGFALRLVPALSAPLVHDENQWMRIVDLMSLHPQHLFFPLHGPKHAAGQVYLAYPFTVLFGDNLLGYRAASILLGTLAIGVAFAIGKSVGGPIMGLIAAFLVTFNEYLIGVARVCTEKNYLVPALISLLVARRFAQTPSTLNIVALGIALGATVLIKESAALWVPPIVLAVGYQAGGWNTLRRAGPWWGVLAFLCVLSPWIYWTAFGKLDAADVSTLGMGFQARSGLSFGTWSWAPLSLFIRPLFYYRVQGAISEYASMTTLPGSLLIGGAIASLFLLRDWFARLLQFLGFGTFLLFALFTVPRGEFWWADLSVLAFVLLTAGVLARAAQSWPRFVGVMLVLVMVPPALRVGLDRVNSFPLDIGTPAEADAERAREGIALDLLRYRNRDHMALYRVGRWILPPSREYRQVLLKYRDHLVSGQRDDTIRGRLLVQIRKVPPSELDGELAWIEQELHRIGS